MGFLLLCMSYSLLTGTLFQLLLVLPDRLSPCWLDETSVEELLFQPATIFTPEIQKFSV